MSASHWDVASGLSLTVSVAAMVSDRWLQMHVCTLGLAFQRHRVQLNTCHQALPVRYELFHFQGVDTPPQCTVDEDEGKG